VANGTKFSPYVFLINKDWRIAGRLPYNELSVFNREFIFLQDFLNSNQSQKIIVF
jgi:hypothetical protein